MSAVELGSTSIADPAATKELDWVRGLGESRTFEYRGERERLEDKYNELKTESAARQLTYRNEEGRARLIARYTRQEETEPNDGVTIIEELYGQDLVRPVYAAPYFAEMTDDQMAAALAAVETRIKEADIEGFAAWTALQKQLRWQMLHGQEVYFETAFMLSVKKQGVRAVALQGVFTGINTVQALPALSVGMTDLVGTLPAGEWLYKPPQVQYAGQGIWSVESEWHWATKWSIVYGGTMAMPT